MKKYSIYLAFILLLSSCSDHAAVKRNFLLDSTLKHNNEIVDKSTEARIQSMRATSEEKPTTKPIAAAGRSLAEKIRPVLDEIAKIRSEIANAKGIYLFDGEYYHQSIETRKARYEEEGFTKFVMTSNQLLEAQPLAVFNKAQPKKVLFQQGKLAELYTLCRQIKADLFQVLDDLVLLYQKEPVRGVKLEAFEIEQIKQKVEQTFPDSTKLEGLFKDASISDCYPILRKIESANKNTVALMVSFLKEQMGTKVLVYDKFEVFSSSEKPYILLGENYEAEIALGAFSSQAEFTVSVNGTALEVEGGKAQYSARPGSVGTQTYQAKIIVVNPLTGETESVRKDFKYEVGRPSVSIENTGKSILYIGVNNPISVAAAGLSSNDLNARISGAGGGTLSKMGGGKYNVKVTKATNSIAPCYIELYDKRTNKKINAFPFEVKSIPDPVVLLTNSNKKALLSVKEMQSQRGLMAVLEDFDFDARCKVEQYTLVYFPVDTEKQEILNVGGAFVPAAQALIKAAKTGDQYLFKDVEARCPGDLVNRRMGMMGVMVE